MFVPCPHCQFLVAHHPQLQSLPEVCPRCGRALADDADASLEPIAEAAHETAAAIPLGSDPDWNAPPEAPAGPAPAMELVPPATKVAQTTPMQARALTRRSPRWQWPLLALLALLLPLQAILAEREQLASSPAWRPVMEQFCALLFCELPAWRKPDEFRMLHSQIRRGTEPNVLRMDATFRNDARWPQPWPALQLALADGDGRTLGSSVVSPEQYLGKTPDAALSPGQSAQITFLVQEPAPGTVSFNFRFR